MRQKEREKVLQAKFAELHKEVQRLEVKCREGNTNGHASEAQINNRDE